jgi:mono/diheme cytochrome c family protein
MEVRMRRWIKWTLGGVGVVVVAAVGAAAAGWKMADHRMARKIDVPLRTVAYVNDAQTLARGKYLYESRGCADCHGVNGGGRTFVNDGKGLHIAGPSITQGGVTGNYKPEDWERIIRHGVKPDGRPAMIMPSEDYNRLTDADLAAIVAHVRALPPQPAKAAIVELPPPVRILYGFGAIPDAASKIDHSLAPAEPVEAGVNVKHGAYVANMCIGCHGEHLSGGKIPGGPPDWPAASNITPGEGSAMTRYKTAPEFIAMLRSGKRPDGTPIKVMPFEALGKLNDVDAQALHAYLQTVPPRPVGKR